MSTRRSKRLREEDESLPELADAPDTSDKSNDAPPEAKKPKTTRADPVGDFSDAITSLIAHISSENTTSTPFPKPKITIGKIKHANFFEGLETIRNNKELSDELKQKCVSAVISWNVYPINIFILDITMQNLVDLVKLVTLALKSQDPHLTAMRYCNPENIHCCMTIAACTGCLELVKFFVDQGLDPNQKDSRGDDALTWATVKLKHDVVEYLKPLRPAPPAAAASAPPAQSADLPPLGDNTITVEIKNLRGTSSHIKANRGDSIYVLKQRYCSENSVLVAQNTSAALKVGPIVALTPEKCRFMLTGKQLENGKTIEDYGIADGTRIMVLYHLR